MQPSEYNPNRIIVWSKVVIYNQQTSIYSNYVYIQSIFDQLVDNRCCTNKVCNYDTHL